MSKKSDQYRKAVDKIHHKLIQEELGDFETKIKSYGNRNIQAPKNATLFTSVKLTELKKEEVQSVFYEMIEQEFEHDSATEYFQAGGGYEVGGGISSCNQTFIKIDDEDKKFGDLASSFEERLEVFGTIVGDSMKLFFPTCEKKNQKS